jgi:AmmeMemoRadiSam system protein B
MVRHPYVAGYFYPMEAAELKATLARLVDKKALKEDAIGLLVPHAGYVYSGPVTGATISRVKFKDTFIIIGPSHSGMGKPFSVMTAGTWRTPLGYLEADDLAHQEEHAVEVQLPFLQYFKPDVRIVPVIIAGDGAAVYPEIGRDIARAIKETKRDVVLLASGDMTHYEPHLQAKEKDLYAVEAMLKLDTAELARRYKERRITMCAFPPVMCVMAAAKELGATRGELVTYRTSGDSSGDYDQVVGYAGVIFKGG